MTFSRLFASLSRPLFRASLKRPAPRRPVITTPPQSAPSIPLFSFLFSSKAAKEMSYPDQRTDQEWRAVLSPEQFRVLRQSATERPHTGEYDKHSPSTGTYTCAGCSAPLYTAGQKFDSGCGWPAYFDAIPGAVKRFEDHAMGMTRTEIVCANCGGHLGHVFKGEGFGGEKDERHCVNSVSLKFSEVDGGGKGASK